MQSGCHGRHHGIRFVAKVRQLFFSPVASSSPDDVSSLWLIASFSRSKFRLDKDSVSLILSSLLGGDSNLLSIVEIDQWVFKFCVAFSKVGFTIYALKSFAFVDFKIHFNLWNEIGLSHFLLHNCRCLLIIPRIFNGFMFNPKGPKNIGNFF